MNGNKIGKDIWLICGWNYNDIANINQVLPVLSNVTQNLCCKLRIVVMNQYQINTDLIENFNGFIYDVDICEANIYSQIKYLIDCFERYEPCGVFFFKNIYSQIAASYISVKLKKGLIADCIDIICVVPKGYRVVRTSLSNSSYITIDFQNCEYGISIIRTDLFNGGQSALPGFGCCELHRLTITRDNTSMLNVCYEMKNHTNSYQKQSNVILIAGMGLKTQSNVDKLCYLATLLGADIGASRAVVENHYLNKKYLVGQSADYEVCVTFGVSGAVQHISGIMKSRTIVAINNDIDANIFKYCNYKIIADANSILDNLINMLEKDCS